MQATPLAHRPITYRLVVLPLLAVAALAGGCSTLDVPRADNYPATGQKKARAVHHWDVLADDVAQRIAAKIGDWPVGEYPIYIPPPGNSGFNLGFRKLLITQLVDRGITVSTHPTAVELVFDAQIVQHQASAYNGLQMPFTRLAAGVAVARDWNLYTQSTASMVGGALAVGALLDISRLATQGAAAGGPTRTEVLITTSLESGQRYLARTSDVYYIDDDDTPLYAVPPPPPPPPAPTPIKSWRVVAP